MLCDGIFRIATGHIEQWQTWIALPTSLQWLQSIHIDFRNTPFSGCRVIPFNARRHPKPIMQSIVRMIRRLFQYGPHTETQSLPSKPYLKFLEIKFVRWFWPESPTPLTLTNHRRSNRLMDLLHHLFIAESSDPQQHDLWNLDFQLHDLSRSGILLGTFEMLRLRCGDSVRDWAITGDQPSAARYYRLSDKQSTGWTRWRVHDDE